MTEKDNGRTHEPKIRELTAEIDGLRALMEAKIKSVIDLANERDAKYTERDNSNKREVQNALTAQDKQTASSFAASKEAIVKAEESQKVYNASHNDLSRKMEAQYATMLPRAEADSRLGALEGKIQEQKEHVNSVRTDLMKEISDLRESRSESAGGRAQGQEGRQQNQWIVSAVLVVLGIIVSVAIAAFMHQK